jgi:hypothetical protein
MEEKVEASSNWFDAPEYEAKAEEGKVRLPKFNITLGKGEIAKSENILFLDDGRPIDNQYGKSILFNINYKGADFVWFVKAKSYSILKEIKKNMPIAGKPAKVTRAGTTQTDTRWAIQF